MAPHRPILLVALLLAGCVGPAATDPRPPEPGFGDARFVAVRSLVDPAENLWEPSLGVAPDGTLWSGSFGRDAQGAGRGAVYRSTDGGHTWEDMGNPTAPTSNGDPHLAVDADGAVWFSTLWVGCVSVAVSRDAGATWRANHASCSGAVGDRQSLAPTHGGHAVLDWQQFPSKMHVAARTDDHGATWTPSPMEPPNLVAATGEVSGWGGGVFWNAATGSLFAPWSWFTRAGGPTSGEWAWQPAFSVSRDGGATWTLHKLDPREARYHGVSAVVGAADAAGNVYLAWVETDAAGDSRVLLTASADDGASWRAPVRVDAPGGSKAMPALAAGAAGRVAIAWIEADEAGHPGEVGEGAAWRLRLAWTQDALAPQPAFGRAWMDEAPLKRGPVCLDGGSCNGGRELGEFFGLARLPEGRVGALWTSAEAAERPTLVFAATAAALL